MRRFIRVRGLILVGATTPPERADGPALEGEWRTRLGIVDERIKRQGRHPRGPISFAPGASWSSVDWGI